MESYDCNCCGRRHDPALEIPGVKELIADRDEWKRKAMDNDKLVLSEGLQSHTLRKALGIIVREVNPNDCGWGYARVIKNTAEPALAFTPTQAQERVTEYIRALEEIVDREYDYHRANPDTPHYWVQRMGDCAEFALRPMEADATRAAE